MALRAGVLFRLHASRAAVVDHSPPDIPIAVGIVIQPGLLQGAKQIEAHGNAALGDAALLNRAQQIALSLFPAQRPGQDAEDLGVLADFRSARSVSEHAAVIQTARTDRLLQSLRAVSPFGGHLRLLQILHQLRRLLQAEQNQKTLHRDRPVQPRVRHAGGWHPALRPVNEGPDGRLAVFSAELVHQPRGIPMGMEKIQDTRYGRKVAGEEGLVPEVHHMIVEHQDPVDGKAGDHVGVLVGIAAVEKAVRPLGPGKIVDRLSCQSVVGRDRVGVQNLRAGVHRILELFIKRAVHIRVVHTPFQRAQADVPNIRKAFVRGRKARFHLQRISRLHIVKGDNAQRLRFGFDAQAQETEGAKPEGLVTFVGKPGPRVAVGISLQVSMFTVQPILFPVSCGITFAL